MKQFHLSIATPKKVVFDGNVESLTVSTLSGYRTILAGHTPLIGFLADAPMHIVVDGKTKYYALHNGMLEIKDKEVTILTNVIESADEIDLNRANDSKSRAEKRIKERDPELDLKRAQLSLERALCRIQAARFKDID